MIQSGDSKYIYELYASNGSLLAELSGRAKNKSITIQRNRAGYASFTMDIYDFEKFCRSINVHPRSIIGVGSNELKVRRLNRYLFGGQIQYYDTTLGDGNEITIRAVGYFDLFKDRYTSANKLFTNTDAGQIAWTLINDSQTLTNGTFGITMGTIQTSVNRDRLYEYKNVRDAIIQLSEVINGFDFEITHDKVFNVYYPRQGSTIDVFRFEYPGLNIKKIKPMVDASDLVNEVIARGQGIGAGQLVVIRSDTVSQATYKLRQKIADFSDISLSNTLIQHADDINASKKDPVTQIEITIDGNQAPAVGSYWVGDYVPVVINNFQLYDNINNTFRINEITINVDDQDSEEIVLRLGA
jgi:hypothetical protein